MKPTDEGDYATLGNPGRGQSDDMTPAPHSSTSETDAQCLGTLIHTVTSDFARKLERERDEARDSFEKLKAAPSCDCGDVCYSSEHDNYYCGKCHCGMGNTYYDLRKERDQLLTENEILQKQAEAYEIILQGSNAECGQIRDELDVTRGKVANLEVRLESNSQAYKILEQERDTALAKLKEANRDADNCRQIIDTYSHQEDDLMFVQTELSTLRKQAENPSLNSRSIQSKIVIRRTSKNERV